MIGYRDGERGVKRRDVWSSRVAFGDLFRRSNGGTTDEDRHMGEGYSGCDGIDGISVKASTLRIVRREEVSEL